MGGGRRRASVTIDYSVGFTDMARLGDSIDGQRPRGGDSCQRRSQLAGSGEGRQAAIILDDKAPASTFGLSSNY